MIDLFGAAREVISFCDSHGWQSCFIGGIAVQRWGEPRVTLLKLFTSRPIDVHDAEAVALRQQGKMDWEYIEEQLKPLAGLKDAPQILSMLARLRKL